MTHEPRRRAKLADVALLAGVGNATVSRVLNGGKHVSRDKMERIEAAIRELEYEPNRLARSLKGAPSGMIGMIVPSISDSFFSQCAEAVEAVAHEHGSLLVVVPSQQADDAIVAGMRQLLLHRIDGLILANSTRHSREVAHELRGLPVPVVGLDGPLSDLGLPSVVCQNYAGAQMATEHLLGHGYRTVVHVQVKPNLYTMVERQKGYTRTMEAAGATPVHETITDREGAVSLLKRHLRGKREPIGIFAANNLTARYVAEAMRLLEVRVPEQVGLLSFDDFDLADTLSPPMSVVQQPIEELGRSAARLLFEQMDRDATGPREGYVEAVMVAPRLLLRESCGCAPA